MVRWLGIFLIFLLAGSVFALENPEQKVKEVIKDYVLEKNPASSRDEIRITFKLAEKTFEELKALEEGAQFKVLEVYPEFKPVGSVIFPLVVTSGENSEKILLRAKVEIIKKVAAAARLIKKGEVLGASDVKLEERDVALLPQKYFIESSPLAGKEARITIPANSTLFEWMVGDQPLIHRGQEVSLVVIAPGLTVKTRGQAMEDGYRDAELKVKRIDSKKIIVGKVISPSEVEVKL